MALSNIDPQPDFGNYQEVDVNALLPPLPRNYEPLIVATVEETNGFGSFAVTFGKAMVNGSVSALVSTFTIGFIEYKPFEVTDQDLANGYAYMEAGAVIVTHVGMAFGTAGLGCVASLGSTAAKGAVMTMRTVEGLNAAANVIKGGSDMVQNGITLENTTQVVSGLIGFAGLGGSKCFTEGTQIVVGAIYDENDVFVQYVTVNIEDIQVGDLVYSYDTITGTTELKEVTDVFVRESDHINYLTIVDEQGREQILETTDGHPFWVVTDEPDLERAAREVVDENGVIIYHENIAPGLNGFWVEAKNLREGDVFIGANGELSTLVAFERVVFPQRIKVYNFTVEGNHNYFVIAKDDPFGQTCILVHNAKYQDWIQRSTYGEIQKKLGKEGAKAFATAMKKGKVGSKGESGIKQLTPGTKIGGKAYQFEIKVFNRNFKDWRVYGNFDQKAGRIVFDLFAKALHK